MGADGHGPRTDEQAHEPGYPSVSVITAAGCGRGALVNVSTTWRRRFVNNTPSVANSSLLSETSYDQLVARYRAVRGATEHFCEPLTIEDHVIQAMADVSPPKWHLAHTTWFFETFVLEPFGSRHGGFTPCDPSYRVLFNSYYQTVGEQHSRPERGFLSRPTVAEIREYRRRTDGCLLELLAAARGGAHWPEIARRVDLGLHHEQQHQELLLMDTKYNFSRNPLEPAYRDAAPDASAVASEPESLRWLSHDGGVFEFGHEGDGFCFDNETPRHRALVAPFALASRLVTNGDFLEFVADGGYQRPDLWLSDGWATVQAERWRSPLYWRERDGAWFEFTLRGARPLDAAEPVVHVSYFEADAFARWAGKRLPSEFEWELVARSVASDGDDRAARGNFVESGRYHPAPAGPAVPPGSADSADGGATTPRQMLGDVWEWTRSSYAPYPGYRPLPGALGEYNGKFMCSQFVLRGGSCLTPESHVRVTYRNFFYPHQRWNTQGFRLAGDGT